MTMNLKLASQPISGKAVACTVASPFWICVISDAHTMWPIKLCQMGALTQHIYQKHSALKRVTQIKCICTRVTQQMLALFMRYIFLHKINYTYQCHWNSSMPEHKICTIHT
jgi:hypothetical protein